MTSQPNKLYRSNINYMSVTVLPPKDFNMTQDYQMEQKFRRQNSNKNTLASTSSQAHLKSKQLNQSIEATKQTMPYINGKDIQNTSFMSIDQAYLNPKFQKKKDFPINRILPNNITDIQSDTQSLGGRSIRTYQGQDEYYKYWKTKAHEYLEENFKLREENKKLKGEMDTMRQKMTKQLNSPKVNKQNTQSKERENKSFAYLEGIFKKKLDDMEHLLQEKMNKIVSLQDQVLELNRKLLGEQERTQLLERLGAQIDTLTHENILLKMQLSDVEVKTQSKQIVEKPSPEMGLRHRYKSREKIYRSARKISIDKGSKR